MVTNLDATNQYYVTAWDNVGNLYAASGTSHRLRVFSPPGGTNQATANASVQIESGGTIITGVTANGGVLTINFIASTNDIASQFILQSSAALNGDFEPVAGAAPAQISAGYFTVSTTPTARVQFYRISSPEGP